ncbi:hypothetical protein [Shinella zoogloeoides]|uniref:hypothetical protein n=1 Tax=Shinella zoogloeoides TaxID=352475 RepID=UPI000E6482BB|nr:hypothetical protein [Shinella zoogloeoides]
MLRNLDFTSWHSLLVTLIGLALFTLISIGIRLVMMVTIQQRRERANRQINERLRTLIAAYKTLGGSFTGNLAVDPTHLRDLRQRAEPQATVEGDVDLSASSERSRRIRDDVEAALSDIMLLGTEEQVRLAEKAVRELVAGRPVHTHDLVVSLRAFIRGALDLDPVPADLAIPRQGPARPSGGSSRGKAERGKEGARSGGGGGGGGMGMGGGGGMGGGLGMGGHPADDEPAHRP